MSPSHLFMFSVGPLAEFIEASRRTRDIHFSSMLVAEMARDACKALSGAGAELIIPSIKDFESDPVTDRLLAYLPHGSITPETAVDKVKEAARKVWNKYITEMENDAKYRKFINRELWDKQKQDEDLIELFAAWTPFEKDKDNYATKRERLDILLAARETLTDFHANSLNERLEKSSLDGRRESVLKKLSEPGDIDRRTQIGVKKGEELDICGALKRLRVEKQEHFVSVSRIAVDPWIRGAENNPARKAAIQDIKEIMDGFQKSKREELKRYYEQHEIKPSARKYEKFKLFTNDEGHFLVRSSLPSVVEEIFNKKLLKDKKFFEDYLKIEPVPFWLKIDGLLANKAIGSPHPYLAVLACDGDGMGKAVEKMSLDEHKEFSEKLTAFAKCVECIVNYHNGSLVYAGGDDALAFLPLDTVLNCAEKLQAKFKDVVKSRNGKQPTLSVGVAIVHMLTPMAGEMIKLANEALNDYAKNGAKNNLSIILEKRSGSQCVFTMNWNEEPAKLIYNLVDLINSDKLPRKAAHDLYEFISELKNPFDEYKPVSWSTKELIQSEAVRIFGRKQTEKEDEKIENLGKNLKSCDSLQDLENLINGMFIAYEISKAKLDAEGKSHE